MKKYMKRVTYTSPEASTTITIVVPCDEPGPTLEEIGAWAISYGYPVKQIVSLG